MSFSFHATQEARFRFLHLSNLLAKPREDVSTKGFAAEHNVWVYWIARPTLCFYRSIETWPQVNLQILEPRPSVTLADCQYALPQEATPFLELVDK